MSNINTVTLSGRLTRDPELRVTPGGFSVCKLGLASSRTFKTKDGERKEETVFVDIDTFGKQAETCAEYLNKGRCITVQGRLKLDEWEEKQTGQKRSKLSLVAEQIDFGSKPESNQKPTQSQPTSSVQAQDQDEVPF